MAKVKFLIKTSAKKTDKTVRIWIRVYQGRDIDIIVDSRQVVEPDYWNHKDQCIKNKIEILDRDEKNMELINLKTKIQNKINDARKKDTKITKEWIETIIDEFYSPEKYKVKNITLFDFIREFIDKTSGRLQKNGKPVSYKQKREYERTLHYLKEYAESKGIEPNFEDIDFNFHEDFISYLQSLNLATNTIGKKIQTLKIFLNDATDKGVNKNVKFRSSKFYPLAEESDSIYITENELDQLYKINLENNKRLEKVRDSFLILCRTGVRYSDLEKINKENIEGSLIFLKQSKTSGKVVIPVHPWVREILDKYDGYPPQEISGQKFNAYLKEVAEKAKLNTVVHKTITKGGVSTSKKYLKKELISSHAGRRSFATNLYKAGFPSRSIMAVTGHKTEAAFLKYIKVTPEEHAVLLQEFWFKNGSHLKVI